MIRIARNKSEAKYPSLWEGRQVALAPFLGPTGTTLVDRSGNALHGTLTNMDAATDWVRSDFGYSLDFDGSNDYIDCGAASPLNITGVVSVSCWIKSAGAGGTDRGIVGKGTYGSSGYHIAHGGAGNIIYLHLQGSFAGSTTAVADSVWRHAVGTYDGANMRIYINGALEGTTAKTGTSTPSGTNFEIGRRPGVGTYWTGSIDDVAVYNRVLSPTEIRILSLRRGIAYQARESSIFARIATGSPWYYYAQQQAVTA